MGGINCIKLLSANKGLLKKAEHNLTTYSGHQELTQKNKISKVHFCETPCISCIKDTKPTFKL